MARWLPTITLLLAGAAGCGDDDVPPADAAPAEIDAAIEPDGALVDAAPSADATEVCGVDDDCDDGNPCTVDACDPWIGCLHEPIDCDDEP